MDKIKKIKTSDDTRLDHSIEPGIQNSKKPLDIELDEIDYKEPPKDKINIFQKIWVWLNGKKTILGAIGATAGVVLNKNPDPIIKLIGGLIQIIFVPLTGIGAIHKIVKSDKIAGKAGELKIGKMNLMQLLTELWISIKKIVLIVQEIPKRIKSEK